MKFSHIRYSGKIDWYLNRMDGLAEADNPYGIDASCDVDAVLSDIKNRVDQGTSSSFQELVGGDHSEQAEWIVVNGVIRRYGFSL